jgi:integrase
MRIIEQDEMQKLEAAAKGELAVVIRLATDTAARRGELCALRWQDLSDDGRLRIWQAVCQRDDGSTFLKPTKTRSERQVKLSPDTLAYLELHREKQRRDAALFGVDYHADLDLILAGPDGGFLQPQALTVAVRRLAEKVGLKGAGLHTLRHSHASIMLSNGAPLAAVSKRLGHRDTHTTARIYSHALPSDEEMLGDLWGSIRKGEGKKMVTSGHTPPVQDETAGQTED